jgi:hypothetical protein
VKVSRLPRKIKVFSPQPFGESFKTSNMASLIDAIASNDAKVREMSSRMTGLTYEEKNAYLAHLIQSDGDLMEIQRTLRWPGTWQRTIPVEAWEFEVKVRIEPVPITPVAEEPITSDTVDPEIEENTNPSLRIGNLSTASDRKKLFAAINAVFGKHGAVRDVNLPMDRTTGNPRGFAFIEFRDPRDAMRAFKAENGRLKIGGRDIRIEMTRSARKTTEEMASIYGTPKK